MRAQPIFNHRFWLLLFSSLYCPCTTMTFFFIFPGQGLDEWPFFCRNVLCCFLTWLASTQLLSFCSTTLSLRRWSCVFLLHEPTFYFNIPLQCCIYYLFNFMDKVHVLDHSEFSAIRDSVGLVYGDNTVSYSISMSMKREMVGDRNCRWIFSHLGNWKGY